MTLSSHVTPGIKLTADETVRAKAEVSKVYRNSFIEVLYSRQKAIKVRK